MSASSWWEPINQLFSLLFLKKNIFILKKKISLLKLSKFVSGRGFFSLRFFFSFLNNKEKTKELYAISMRQTRTADSYGSGKCKRWLPSPEALCVVPWWLSLQTFRFPVLPFCPPPHRGISYCQSNSQEWYLRLFSATSVLV